MPPFLQVNDQYCVLGLETVATQGVQLPLVFSDTFQLVDACPVEPNEQWKEDKGRLFWQAVDDTRCFLVFRQPGNDPGLLPNDAIKKPAIAFLRGLLLTGIPWSDGQYLFTGGVHADRTDIRQIQELREFHLDLGLPRADHFDEARLRTAYDLGKKILALNAGGWNRIARGFHYLWTALIVDWMEDRFHMFIRALDAVVKTSQGQGRVTFRDRCNSTFLAPHPDNPTALEDMYYIRNTIEHIHDLDPEPRRLADSVARRETRERRLRQLEVLALGVYRRIIGDSTLLADLDTDAKIDAFWALPDDLRAARWNARIPLDAIV
ncbi:MAG TPA: hypothetical protein VF950_21525 [Planctomycetota bacterium]